MKLSVAQVLEKTDKIKKKVDRIQWLRENDTKGLRTILQGCFDPRLEWLLPEGEVPYTPNTNRDLETIFQYECRKLYLFVKGGNDNLRPGRREQLFVELLEGIDAGTAKVVASIKDRKMPFNSITPELVREAFPGLLPDEQEPAPKPV